MKKILVLTGTTGFPMLETSILSIAEDSEDFVFTLQTKNPVPFHCRVEHEHFINMRELDCNSYDGVIGHCGAGTTFWALDNHLRFLAVVDLHRADSHQQDLGSWLDRNRYGLVVENRPLTIDDIISLCELKFEIYVKDKFKFDRFDKLTQDIR